MTKGTQIWDIDKKRAFFRAYIKRETSLDAAGAERLADALTKAVNMMRVWELPREEQKPSPRARGKSPSAPADTPFDPYAFSLMVVLAKTGKDGLAKRLAEIKSAENLRTLAEAQHLAVNTALKRPEELRKAIIAATVQRLADRKAAAS
jgi:hypothetical protein